MNRGLYILLALILALMTQSCNKGDREDNIDIDANFCVQLTDTTGLNLFYFSPFSEYEWKFESHDYKVQKRQIPEKFLKSLTLEKLVLQCVWLDMASDMLLFGSYQAGFISIFTNFNCVQELYKRNNIHLFLEEKLRSIDVRDMVYSEKCRFYNRFLEYVFVQKECLSLYEEEEILYCLNFIFEKVERLSFLISLEMSEYKSVHLSSWMLGIANVLLMHEYQPFLDELDSDIELLDFLEGRINANANVITKISKHGTDFYNKKKIEK